MKFKIDKNIGLPIVFMFEEDLDSLDQTIHQLMKDTGLFQAKEDEIFPLFSVEEKRIYVGLGKKEELTPQILRKQSYQLGNLLLKRQLSDVSIQIIDFKYGDFSRELCAIKAVSYIVEGLIQSSYLFDRYKSEKKKRQDLTIHLDVREGYEEKAQFSINETEHLMEGVFLTRDLVNTPSNDLYPKTLAKEIKKNLEPLDVKVTVLTKKEIEELDMKAYLEVARGSSKSPRFIIMEYLPVKDKPPIALVGKGLTYDSGGYAIKPWNSMADMKGDMGGAATVVGTIYALAKNKVPRNVIGLVAACENMIDGDAYRNGDIISSMKGLTIEVENTDAEGRLTLADALYYAATKTEAETIIDIATLTGASISAVGRYTTALISNRKELVEQIEKAADASGEYVWELRANDELRDQVKGELGDLSNTGGTSGGCITAGIFLEHFVENKPWLHLDIAGPSFNSKKYSYLPKGATGIPVKTLYRMILNTVKDRDVK